MNFQIRRRPRVLEAWSQERLSFDPKDWRRDLRRDLAAGIRELGGEPGAWLRALYRSEDRSFCDVENCLMYNVGTSAFRALGSGRLQLERSFSPPSNLDEVHAPHYYRYAVTTTGASPEEWTRGATLGTWDFRFEQAWSSLKPHDAWFAAVSGNIEAERPSTPPASIGVVATIHPPRGRAGSLVNILKPLLDGVLCAFHAHDGHRLDELVQRLGALLAENPAASHVQKALTEECRAVLGVRRLIWPYRNGVQWNPADDLCVWIDAEVGPPCDDSFSRCRGEVFTCSPVPNSEREASNPPSAQSSGSRKN